MELYNLRQKINALDKILIYVLAERQNLIPEVANYKKLNNIQRYQPQRERLILMKNKELSRKLNLNLDLITDITKRIIQDSHRIEKEIIGK